MAQKYYKNSKGERLKRCTSIIDILGYNKQALLAWAKKYGPQAQKISDKALDIGTLTHKMIEAHVTGADVDFTEHGFDAVVLAQNGLDSYKRWEDIVQPEYVVNEMCIISESGNWGGTTDVIMKVKAEHVPEQYRYVEKDVYTVLSDYKTAKAIYADHIVQTGAYKHGVDEMQTYSSELRALIEKNNDVQILSGIDVDICMLIHIKKDLTAENANEVGIYWLSQEAIQYGYEAFKMALRLHEIQPLIKAA